MKPKKIYPNGRPNQRNAERYGKLTRTGEWARLGKLARDVKRNRKKALKQKILQDFIDNPRAIVLIAKKFNVTESTANYVIDKYTRVQYKPKQLNN